jgi:hypothetical protein
MSKKPKSNDAHWAVIYQQLKEDGVEFFVNSQLEPTVRIPTDGFQTEWPADSLRFQDHLVSVYYEISNGEILKASERDFLMAQIREECRKGGRRLTEPEATETENDVIVQATLALMNRVSEFSTPTVQLLDYLQKIQKEGCLATSEGIPIFTNIFSRKLSRLIPVLRGYGVEVVMEHKESGSHCTLKRMPSFQIEPKLQEAIADGSRNTSSGKSSAATTGTGTDLPSPDDTDGEFRGDDPKANNGVTDMKNLAAAKKGGAK